MKTTPARPSPESLLRQAALYLLAFAWPWGIYQTERLLFLPFILLPAALLAVLEIRSALRGRRPRVPVELLWPLAVLFGAAGVYAARTDTLGMLAVVLLETVTVFTLIQAVRSRIVLIRCLGLSVTGGTLAAATSLLIDSRVLMNISPIALLPAGYSSGTGASLAFAPTVPNGVLTLAWCATFAGAFLLRRASSRLVRVGALLALALLFGALARVGLEVFAWPRVLPNAKAAVSLHEATAMAWNAWRAHATLGAESFAAVIAVLWLISRTWGKVYLSWRDTHDAFHGAALTALGLAGLCAALLPLMPQAGYAVALGLLVRDVFPWRDAEKAPAWPCLAPLLLVPLLLANIVRVNPENPHDPRNYTAVIARWYAAGQFHEAEWLTHFVWAHSPGERRNAYAMARAELESATPDLALVSHYFVRMAAPGTNGPSPVLPAPTEKERDALLTRLRDAAAARPENSGFAYERALVALGQPDNAIEALSYRIRPAAARTGDVPMMASVVAALLGAPELESSLRAWDAPMLYDVLSQYEPRLAQRTTDVEMLAVLSLSAEEATVQVWSSEGVQGAVVPAPANAVEKRVLRITSLACAPDQNGAGEDPFPITMTVGAPEIANRLFTSECHRDSVTIEVDPEAWGLTLSRPLLVALP